MIYGTLGAEYLAELNTPLLDPVWVVNPIADGSKQCFVKWTSLEVVEPKLSTGEAAVCALARSLDGVGLVNTRQALGAISYELRVRYLRLLNQSVERMTK